MAEIYDVSISGRGYKISRHLLEKHPDSTLSRACLSACNNNKGLYFERPIQPFEAVLELYQTGFLHAPPTRCFLTFTRELEFWGFKESDIAVCCRRKMASFRSEQKDLDDFDRSCLMNSYSYETNRCCCCVSGPTRIAIWNCLDNYDYNIIAKILFCMSISMILLSTAVAILQTHTQFDVRLKDEHWRTFFGELYKDNVDVISLVNSFHDGHISRESLESEMNLNETDFTVDQLIYARIPNPIFIMITLVCTAYFTLELVVRLAFCPNYRIFFNGILNWIDALALIMAFMEITINQTTPREEYASNYLDLMQLVQVLRVLRLFRLARNITGARVLIFAVKNSLQELCFMVVLLGITSVVFGTLFYCFDTEAVNNISYATWWAIITMTTVGYGDVVPTNTSSRIIGIACASFGVLLIAITVPLFVNNFLTVYTYAQSKKLVDKNKTLQRCSSQVKPDKSKKEVSEQKHYTNSTAFCTGTPDTTFHLTNPRRI